MWTGGKFKFGDHCKKPQLQLQSAQSVTCTINVDLIKNKLWQTKKEKLLKLLAPYKNVSMSSKYATRCAKLFVFLFN